MANDRYVVRNDKGAGVIFKTKKEVDKFLSSDFGKGYELVDAEAESKAVEESENKSAKKS